MEVTDKCRYGGRCSSTALSQELQGAKLTIGGAAARYQLPRATLSPIKYMHLLLHTSTSHLSFFTIHNLPVLFDEAESSYSLSLHLTHKIIPKNHIKIR